MKIGIFGGTFNPPHKTHVEIAQKAKSQLGLDKLLIFPCGEPPHKFCYVDKNLRFRMTEIAFDGIGEVDDYELNKQGKSYTSDTVRHLLGLYPDSELFLIVGGDSLRDFSTWHEPEFIASNVTLVVADRKNVEFDKTDVVTKYGAKVVWLDCNATDFSSTEIRLRYQFGFDATEYVSQAVDEFVKKVGLYREYAYVTERLPFYLKPTRLNHTFYVVKAGLEIKSDCNSEKVFLACALHDVAKYVDKEKYSYYGFDHPEYPEPVIHAFLGELVAKKDFGIEDEEILNAIKYHTTGRIGMTQLDMVVYVADKTEQSRPYPTAHLIGKNLTETFYNTLVEANQICIERGRKVFSLSFETMDYYKKILNK